MRLCLHCGATYVTDVACPACSAAPSVIAGFTAHAPDFAERGSGFRPEYFQQLAVLESENFWFRARNGLIVDVLRRYFPATTTMLEIGCGTGFVLEGIAKEMPHVALTGSEIFIEGLTFAKIRVEEAILLQMDARHIPFREEFDVIGAFDVLEHIHEDERVLSEMWRSVRRGGGVIVTVPQHPFLWSAQDQIACHVRRYRRGEMEHKLIKAGFQIEMSTSFVSLLLPLLAFSRLTKGPVSKDRDPAYELRLPRPVNKALYAMLRVERHLIGLGVRFPAGGTRLIAARK